MVQKLTWFGSSAAVWHDGGCLDELEKLTMRNFAISFLLGAHRLGAFMASKVRATLGLIGLAAVIVALGFVAIVLLNVPSSP
jgi:hypothetical protein